MVRLQSNVLCNLGRNKGAIAWIVNGSLPDGGIKHETVRSRRGGEGERGRERERGRDKKGARER